MGFWVGLVVGIARKHARNTPTNIVLQRLELCCRTKPLIPRVCVYELLDMTYAIAAHLRRCCDLRGVPWRRKWGLCSGNAGRTRAFGGASMNRPIIYPAYATKGFYGI
jgi:hypothetical protein